MPLELDLRWQPVGEVGLEHCRIWENSDGINARSVLIGEFDGFAYGAQYDIQLASDWTFRSLTLRLQDGRVLRLLSNGLGDWKINGRRAPELEGCVDIDISGSPFTNTLPIRRAHFTDGVPQQFAMAWVPLDSLEPFRDGQIYTRLDATHYRYQAADGSFEQVLEVDAEGFVLDYPTLFRRV